MLDILNYNPFSKYESVFNTLNSKPKSIRRKLHELTNKYSKISFDLKIYDKYGNIPLLGTLMKLIKYLKMNDKNLIILPSVFIYIIQGCVAESFAFEQLRNNTLKILTNNNENEINNDKDIKIENKEVFQFFILGF